MLVENNHTLTLICIFAIKKLQYSRIYKKELGGGALLDVDIYLIMYAMHLFGQLPDKVESTVKFSDTGVDEINTVQFTYQNGAIARLQSSICSYIGEDAVITGSKGKIVVPAFYRAQKAMVYD